MDFQFQSNLFLTGSAAKFIQGVEESDSDSPLGTCLSASVEIKNTWKFPAFLHTHLTAV